MVKKRPPSEFEFPRSDKPDSYAPHNPDALAVAPGSSLVWALRGIPYTASTAAADVIDNSIAAGAQNVWILNRSAQDPMDSYIAFVDDGHGMTEAELHKAMIHGSSDPRRDREAGDFGRFGLGMKTASLSQGKRLTVWSKKSGHKAAIRQWDLELQGEEGWVLFSQPQRAAERLALQEVQRLSGVASKSSGTIVMWSCLDVLLEMDRAHQEPASEKDEGLPIHVRIMNRKVTEIIEHSEAAFHRFLGPIDGRPKRLTLARVFEDGSVHKCTPWDPFLQGKAHVDIPVERPPQQKVLRGKPGEATLQPVILPHESNVPSETFASLALPHRNLNSLQGFYVYREERLIVVGDWLGLYTPEIHYSLGRIAIFLRNDKDSDKIWSIKVNKDSVQIPDAARQELVRIAKSTRKRSNDVFRRSGQTRGPRTEISKTLVPLWVQKRVDLDGERFLQFKINRAHPLVKLVVKEPQRLAALLSAIESGMPYEAIKNLMSDGDKFTEESDPTVALSHLKEVIEILAAEDEKPCDTLTRVAKDVAPYNSSAFAVAVGLLRAELGAKLHDERLSSMPSFDSPRDARVENLVRRYIENHGRKARDGKTIHMLVKLIADGLDIEAPREPSYASLVDEACERLAFEVPHFPPPDPIGVNSGEDDDGDKDEPPRWIDSEHVWPKDGFWARYRRYLLGKFSPDKVDALDRTTNGIMRYLGNPTSRKSEWKRFGAVIGQVQSGKTGTFVGLLAKAMDAGYIHIIVLSGLHNNLRSQTQIRIDEGLVGVTNYNGTWENIGVGNLPGEDSKVKLGSPAVLTTAEDAGDFAKNSQGWRGTDRPTIVVIKKNVAILQRFRAEMMSDVGTNSPKFTLPAIIIDDEADQASVNSKSPDNPTAINREVRTLMDLYKKASYVGFTATPFANIFIDPDATFEDVQAGRKVPDLYPRHLIRLLQPSAEYFGPRELLAYEGDGPRLTAPADDYQDWLAPKHKKNTVPGAVPESLKDALAAFMIGTAIKRLRKGSKGLVGYDPEMNEHTTMLVHVTRFNDVQALVRDQVRMEFDLAKHELLGGSLTGPWYRRIKAQYSGIVSMGDALRDNLAPELATWLIGKTFSFDQAIEHLRMILREFEIEVVNGEVEDALRYRTSRARIIVAVGGDKLSRGLTLEGLTVSYYLRNAANWDTLMQMGRWFGYRERYLDLCRVYMPATLEVAYEEVLEAIVDLEDQLRKADISGAEPLDFCLVLVGSSLGKMPTGRMGDKKKMYQVGGYGGGLLQKRVLPIEPDSEAFRNARKAFGELIVQAAPHKTSTVDASDSERMILYKGVPSEIVQSFIRLTNLPQSGTEEDTDGLAGYLQEHARAGRLLKWTIGIPSVDKYPAWDTYEKIKIAGLEIGPSRRRSQGKVHLELPGYRRTVTLIGPAHEGAGLTDAQLTAGEIKNLPAESIKPEQYRKARLLDGQPTEGLLLVYPVVNAKEKDKPESGQPHHPWTVAWAMSLPPIAEDKKRRAFVPKATWDAWARTREIIKVDEEAEV